MTNRNRVATCHDRLFSQPRKRCADIFHVLARTRNDDITRIYYDELVGNVPIHTRNRRGRETAVLRVYLTIMDSANVRSNQLLLRETISSHQRRNITKALESDPVWTLVLDEGTKITHHYPPT